MHPLLVPFHQDDRLPEGAIPLDGDTFAPELPEAGQWERLGALYDGVADEVATRLRSGDRATVVSGDCLTALGTLTGVQRTGLNPALIWFDAHGDVHTLDSSTSGYLGGMALRFALGAAPEALARKLNPRALKEKQVTLVDARDLDPAELSYLETAAIARAGVDEVEVPDAAVVLHVDVDVIDAAELPGLLFPASGGPARDTVLAAVRRVLESGRVVALDIACPWEPGQDTENRRALLAEITR